jgi:hypothetical protein
MKRRSTLLLLFIVTINVLFASACPKRVSIADVEANPGKYRNKDIAIAGTVQDSYGVNIPGTPLRGGAYKISDGTGSIWVLTEDSVPRKGSQIGVKGRVGSGVSWKGQNYGLGIFEKDRRSAKR